VGAASPGRLFVAITPNDAEKARGANPKRRKLWGLVHPNLLHCEFCLVRFAVPARLVASLRLDMQAASIRAVECDTRLSLIGAELQFTARL
jgi:hypothetical protein